MGCTERCWLAVRCPACGRPVGPRGRSQPLEVSGGPCCEDFRTSAANERHLWDEHDSARHYTDPEGWAAHAAGCERCRDG